MQPSHRIELLTLLVLAAVASYTMRLCNHATMQQAQVFQPGWRQPTMTLDEFADMEVKDALEREERNK